ncbi:DUF4402 domain-containing protein [Marinobacter sp. W-8]|uniref:DUF4402 domain-containing protein n=1 Tax=Marinobacter sp. W-8 TaxID=3369658 RepID=UPI0037CA437B
MKQAINQYSLTKEASMRCLLFLFYISPSVISAQEIEESIALSFGTVAITGNNSISTLELPRSGRNLVITGNLIAVENGEPGRYRLTGFPPNTSVDIEVDSASMTAGGTGIPEPITVHNFDIASVFTNDLGEAEFQLGASFSTSGNGGDYQDAPYSGGAQMRLNFWAPSVADFVTVTQNVEFRGEVRSGFALNEAVAMHFGTLFARGEPNNQASLRLFPDGRLDIDNNGDAKILSLSPPRAAVLVVSGAAPNRELSIGVDSSDIEMRHRDNPTGPHFILTNIETSPSGTGRTDDTGELEIGVGATLTTQKTSSNVVYPSGTYEATYSITVSY